MHLHSCYKRSPIYPELLQFEHNFDPQSPLLHFCSFHSINRTPSHLKLPMGRLHLPRIRTSLTKLTLATLHGTLRIHSQIGTIKAAGLAEIVQHVHFLAVHIVVAEIPGAIIYAGLGVRAARERRKGKRRTCKPSIYRGGEGMGIERGTDNRGGGGDAIRTSRNCPICA
jgi:hypothetical protein